MTSAIRTRRLSGAEPMVVSNMVISQSSFGNCPPSRNVRVSGAIFAGTNQNVRQKVDHHRRTDEMNMIVVMTIWLPRLA